MKKNDHLITEWANSLEAARRSIRTVQLHTYYIERFARTVDLLDATTADALNFIAHPVWSRSTAKSARTALVGFYTWAKRAGYPVRVDVDALPVISENPPRPKPTPESLYRQALEESSERVRLMLRLAGEEGLRRSEVARVHISDLSRDDYGDVLTVHGKGGKIREVPINADLAREIRRACENGGGWAFPSPTGNHLTSGYVGVLVARALPDGLSMHSLRHRFATRVWNESHDLLTTSILLGHANPNTTKRYILPDSARLREVAMLAA